VIRGEYQTGGNIMQDARMIEKSKPAIIPGAGFSKCHKGCKKFSYFFLLIATLQLVSINFAVAQDRFPDSIHTVKNIAGEGACIIEGMTAEQARLVALQRARAMVIEQAAGVLVSSSTLVKDFVLTADFIKTYSKGFITKEKIEWLPLGQYQKDVSSAPIPEYRVKLFADVYVPEKKIKPLGLQAKLNSSVYKEGEKASLNIKIERKAKIAIFNITANDEVVMLFPNKLEKSNIMAEKASFVFPSSSSKIDFVMQNIKGHNRDVEAVMLVAMDAAHERNFMDIFSPLSAMKFSAFFRKFAEVADYCEDMILTYEIVANDPK
jgi:hypothetical protein